MLEDKITKKFEEIKQLMGSDSIERAVDLFLDIYNTNPEIAKNPTSRHLLYPVYENAIKAVDKKQRVRYRKAIRKMPYGARTAIGYNL